MARIRTIKPEFFQSESVSSLSYGARLTWIGLWCHGDDYGRHKADPRLVKGAVWPLDDDVTIKQISQWLDELELARKIHRYEVDGTRYLVSNGWSDHQKVDRPGKNHFPAPPMAPEEPSRHSRDTLATVSTPDLGRGTGDLGPQTVEGEARTATLFDAEPPQFCIEHPFGAGGKPCGACADRRRIHEKWVRDTEPLRNPTNREHNLAHVAELAARVADPRSGALVAVHEHRFNGPDGTCTVSGCTKIADQDEEPDRETYKLSVMWRAGKLAPVDAETATRIAEDIDRRGAHFDKYGHPDRCVVCGASCGPQYPWASDGDPRVFAVTHEAGCPMADADSACPDCIGEWTLSEIAPRAFAYTIAHDVTCWRNVEVPA